MMNIRFLFLIGLLLVPALAHAAPNDVTGTWTTHKKDVIVRIERCGAALCGTIDWLRGDVRQSTPAGLPLCHAEVLSGFVPDAAHPGDWTGGTIYQAAEDKTYKGRLHLGAPDRLDVRGYIGLPALGKTKTMTRVAADSYTPCNAATVSSEAVGAIAPAAGN